MNRSRAATVVALLSMAGLTGLFGPLPAHAADQCLQTPSVGTLPSEGNTPILTTADAVASVFISFFGDILPDCDGTTATVQKADGSLRREVPFVPGHHGGMPPRVSIVASFPVRLLDGAGEWAVTKVSRGAESIATSLRFRIRRGSITTIDQPATVTSPTKTTVTGLVRRYTSTGVATAPPGGTAVLITHQYGTSPIASARTGTGGRYTALVALSVHTTMRAVSPETTSYAGSASGPVTARIRAGLVRLVVAPTGFVNRWVRIDGQVFPRTMWTTVAVWNGRTWVDTGSFGYSAADGTFTRWWKPSAPGTFRLRVSMSKNNVDGSPIVRDKAVTVTSRQTIPTYLDGVVGPTSDPVVHVGTKMSTFGHLKVRYSNGRVGPFANQVVVVQVRPLSDPTVGWYIAAARRTGSTGYFYDNWIVLYPGDAEVRLVYTSPYETIKSAQLSLGVVDVH